MSLLNPFHREQNTPAKIGFLLLRVSQAVKRLQWETSTNEGINPTQLSALAFLHRTRPNQLTVSAVADYLEVSPPTASDTLRSLVNKKLARKRPAPEDARFARIELTDRAKKRMERLESWADPLERAVREALTPEESEQALHLIRKIVLHLRERGEIRIADLCRTCSKFVPDKFPGTDTPHYCNLLKSPLSEKESKDECVEFRMKPVENKF
jgi:DNA-binding MarR family transcriptional regulator